MRQLVHLDPEVLVFDDASEPPARGAARVIRDGSGAGYIAGRNRIVGEARGEFVLLLDDDAMVLEGAAVDAALDVLRSDPSVIAVAFAQGEADGRAWPVAMQPSRATEPSRVCSFIGFAHLVRREWFLRLGGYREELVFYGEEKEFCLRALDAGHVVVYLPDARIAHVPDRGGRSPDRYVRFVTRNDCLFSLFNEPLPLVLLRVPWSLVRFRRFARLVGAREPGALAWVLRELAAQWPAVRRLRRPVRWSTIRRWRRLRAGEPYGVPAQQP